MLYPGVAVSKQQVQRTACVNVPFSVQDAKGCPGCSKVCKRQVLQKQWPEGWKIVQVKGRGEVTPNNKR